MSTTIKEVRVTASSSYIRFPTLFYLPEQRKSTLGRVEMELDEADEMVKLNVDYIY
jgi:hypothetical protein